MNIEIKDRHLTAADQSDAARENNHATYCPEDNKLRLYIPDTLGGSKSLDRESYEYLICKGWKWSPKQDCDFVATWSPLNQHTALLLIPEYEDIGDEDQSPQDRAADRAERYAGYQGRRLAEAQGFADDYDSGGAAGCQNQGRADRIAAKRDRTALQASTQWGKAEYWVTRTAGVIRHALYNMQPEVRRGRIVRLESELRRCEPGRQWAKHLTLRLAYERTMLQGGSLSEDELQPGHCTDSGEFQIVKVHRSPATKLIVSITLVQPSKWGKPERINVQRMESGGFRPPTAAEAQEFDAWKKREKAKTKAENAGKPKLINPTEEDAKKLQAIINGKRTNREAGEVLKLSQATYSRGSKSGCSPMQATFFDTNLDKVYAGYAIKLQSAVFKLRIHSSHGVNRVIVLIDKPQKPVPWNVVAPQ